MEPRPQLLRNTKICCLVYLLAEDESEAVPECSLLSVTVLVEEVILDVQTRRKVLSQAHRLRNRCSNSLIGWVDGCALCVWLLGRLYWLYGETSRPLTLTRAWMYVVGRRCLDACKRRGSTVRSNG